MKYQANITCTIAMQAASLDGAPLATNHTRRGSGRPEPKNGWFRIESPIEIENLYWFVTSGFF